MKTMPVVLFGLLAPAAFAATDPASDLCDQGGGGSRVDRALNIVRFHRAIERGISPLQESQLECVERRLEEVAPAVEAYCLARHERGHDLASRELSKLDSELTSLSFACDREDYERQAEILEKIAPETCSDLVSSYRALIEVSQARGDGEKPWVRCLTENLNSVAPPVVEMCASTDLTVRAAYVEIGERIARVCPGAFSSQ